MSTEIYYFSGTGNSLFAAREIQKRLPDAKLIPIISLLKNEVIKTEGAAVGFFFPVYIMALPVPVRKFLERVDLSTADYIFSVMTCAVVPGPANIYMEKILKKKNKTLDSCFILKMISNSPAGLRPVADKGWVDQISEDKISKLDREVLSSLDSIQMIVNNGEKRPIKDTYSPVKNFFNKLLYHAFSPLGFMIENSKIKYVSDSTCNGCGICEKVCLSGKIKIVDRKPVWKENVKCYFCYACFNSCPMQAILVNKIYTLKSGRYIHPGICANDIAAQK